MTHDAHHMTNGQRWQAAQDWRAAQGCIIAAIFGLCLLVSVLEPVLI